MDEVNVTKEDFYYEQNQHMFETLQAIKFNNMSIDLISIMEYQKDKYDVHYVNEITNLGLSTFNYKSWEKVVIEKAVCRRQIEVAQRIIELATESKDASGLFNQDFNSYVDGELEALETVVMDTMQSIDDYLERRIDDGIPSGIKPLDHFITGFKKGDIYYLGARPSIGKSAFALQIVKGLAEQNKKIAFFSLEMSKNEIGKRLLVNESRVHMNIIKERKVDTELHQKMNNAANKLIKYNVSVSDKGGQTVEAILTKARRHKKKFGLDIIFIDHFHILESSIKGQSMNEKATHNSRMLKYIAKELEIPIVCLVQLNRKLEERPKLQRMPIMSDIRDSGSLEQDADVIMFMNRDDYWFKDELDYEPDNLADIKIAKNRNGETGRFKLRFYGGTQRFETI